MGGPHRPGDPGPRRRRLRGVDGRRGRIPIPRRGEPRAARGAGLAGVRGDRVGARRPDGRHRRARRHQPGPPVPRAEPRARPTARARAGLRRTLGSRMVGPGVDARAPEPSRARVPGLRGLTTGTLHLLPARAALPRPGVEWIFVSDRATQLSLFRAGQIDIPSPDGQIPPSEVDALRTSRPAFPIAFWDGLAVRTLAMRTDRPPFSDSRVRRALSLAIDRKRWVARYFEGHGTEDDGAVPAAFTEWKLSRSALGAGARFLDHDPALARSLLAEAGFANGLKVKCTYWAGAGPEHVEEIERLAGAF